MRFPIFDNNQDKIKEFECGICKFLCRFAANLPCCYTSYVCVECLNQYYQQKSCCPFCKQDHSYRKRRAHAAVNAYRVAEIDRVTVRCPWFQQGCQVEYFLGRNDVGDVQHLLHCRYAVWNCEYCKASKPCADMSTTLYEHQKSDACMTICWFC